MTVSPEEEAKEFAKFLASPTPEQIAEGNAATRRQAQEEFEAFQAAHAVGRCYLCGRPYESFSTKRPCPHWLLRPKGFKKKHIEDLGKTYGFFQIQSYLRWLSNSESFATGINDLPEETSGKKLFELTIRYRRFTWSFSCSEADYRGHATSANANFPHYYIQMRIDGQAFINFNDFHLPFSRMDLLNKATESLLPGRYMRWHTHGEGMSVLLNEETLPMILAESTVAENPDDGHFHIESFVEADEGKTISGDDVAALIQEAKEMNVTVASLLHKLPNAKTKIIVSPGPAVVEHNVRSPRKGDV